jgi:hypothetical protein
VDVKGPILGAVIAGVAALAGALLARRLLPAGIARRFALSIGFGTGVFVGFALTHPWAELRPVRHWQWLPWLALFAAAVGPIGTDRRMRHPLRWLSLGVLAAAAAWMLVPTWAQRLPPRDVRMVQFYGAVAVTALGFLLAPLPGRVPARALHALLFVVATCVAMAVAALASLSNGTLAGLVAAAAAGVGVIGFWRPDDAALRGLLPAYCVTLAGAAFIGGIEPNPPLYGVFAIPAALLLARIWAIPPLARWRGAARVVLQIGVILVPLAATLVWVWLSTRELAATEW